MSDPGTTLRVRYAETDQMGVAYHGALLPWFEMGRTDWLKQSGLSYRQIEETFGIHLAVVEASLKYTRRIGYDDEITVITEPDDLGPAKISFQYTLQRDGQTVATGFSRHACVDQDGRPVRWPEELRARLEPLIRTP